MAGVRFRFFLERNVPKVARISVGAVSFIVRYVFAIVLHYVSTGFYGFSVVVFFLGEGCS